MYVNRRATRTFHAQSDDDGLGDLGRWGGFRKVFHAVQRVNPLHKIEQKIVKQVVRDTKRVVKAIKQDSRPDRLRKNLKYVAAAAAIYFGGPYAMSLIKTYGMAAVKGYMAMRQMRARGGQPQPADANADFQNYINSGQQMPTTDTQPQNNYVQTAQAQSQTLPTGGDSSYYSPVETRSAPAKPKTQTQNKWLIPALVGGGAILVSTIL